MSTRERFFNKVQQKHNTTVPGDGAVDADIQAFCQRMNALAQQVQQWFDGSGIEVIIGTKTLQDLSTVGRSLNNGASRYDITTIRVQNDTRSVSILPEQLYQLEQKGCLTMTVEVPDLEPTRQHFYLSMAPEAGWVIRNERQLISSNHMMTEDVFFRAIENLA
ncbi:hypothetical protein [Buttiauxella sp. S19-1]|uniref:hypothetical protein n=1 Tax=Buttiauxella sp. S19-1 TaxID=941430 RepID=UPI001ED9DCDB